MVDTVRIRRLHPGLWSIAPPGAPTVVDQDPGVDTAVLEVAGGHLAWSLTAGQRVAAATLHDLDTAQEWLWALYGAEIALAADAYSQPVDLPARPDNPELAAAVRRLAYAHWAARWWPASTVDDIAALDPGTLDSEIAELTEFCESVVDGADSTTGTGVEEDTVTGMDAGALDRATARADEYALAAGVNRSGRGADLVLARGTTGWDWRYCPAGVVDASERAVSWELFRAAGSTVARVHAVAAPGVTADLPGHLRPHALIRTRDGFLDLTLELNGDAWTGETTEPADSVLGVEIYVPGVGRSAPAGHAHGVDPFEKSPRDVGPARTSDGDGASDNASAQHIPIASGDVDRRRMVRDLARNRLRLAAAWSAEIIPAEFFGTGEFADSAGNLLADIAPLRSEVTAAMEDSDF